MRIPYGHQWIGPREVAAVVRTLRSDWLTQGPTIAQFEAKLAKVAGARDVAVLSSGTAALHAACFALDLKKDDEVITSPLTFAASANCVLYMGATPRFADIDPKTGTIDPRALERAITRRTKAIIPVDYAGNLCDWDAILRIARRHRLAVIEDASHAIGGRFGGRPVGSYATMTVFSFHPVKHITTGEGGAIATNDPALARRIRRFRQHGITREPQELQRHEGPWYYEMQELGYNYRLTDLQCALGIVQLSRLHSFLKRRREIVAQYHRAFQKLPGILLLTPQPNSSPAWHLYVIRLTGHLQKKRREIFEALKKRGLGVNVHYIPVHLQPYYRKRFGYRRGDFPNAEAFYDAAITIPLYPAMRDRDVVRVICAVREVVGSPRSVRD